MWDVLRKAAAGNDYFADLGRPARVAAAVALAPFALLFAVAAVVSPLGAVINAVRGDWQIAWINLASAVGAALFAFPFCWFELRLIRGRKAANGVTVLPTWLVRTLLLVFIGPLLLGLAALLGMQAYIAARGGDGTLAALWAAWSVGTALSLVRAVRTSLRLRDRPADDAA